MRYTLLFISLFISAAIHAETPSEQAADLQTARQTVQGFAKDLKQVLISSMKADGPVAALQVCNISAPAIAQQHENSPWQVSRSSLKVRNENNQADAWLQQVLKTFEQRKQNGEAISKMEYSEQRPDGWYFVKAIPTGEPCLACHGSNLKPAVQEKIAELYPNDQATGFKLGDIRGAFIVKKQTFQHWGRAEV